MFGYVTPCKMELKMKDYEKFKAYYCGLCISIKNNIGNIPRVSLNYDMTFLALLLDSLECNNQVYMKKRCLFHPANKKIILKDNAPLKYAAFCNISLSYFKVLDDVYDENSLKGKIMYLCLKRYLSNMPDNFKNIFENIKNKLESLYTLEKSSQSMSIDALSHPFGDLTGFILKSYNNYNASVEDLYLLGYNLGKWIYIIDALDDLKKDMQKNKFNAINVCFNDKNLCYDNFIIEIMPRIDFILGTCAAQCTNIFNKLPIKKNKELIYNILQYGLLDKMDRVFKRGVYKNEKSI